MQGQITTLLKTRIFPRPSALSLSADGLRGAVFDKQGRVIIWEAATGRILQTLAADAKHHVSAVALGADPDLIAIGYDDADVALVSLQTEKTIREFNGHLGEILALAFSPDGSLLATSASDATTQIWETATGKRLQILDSKPLDGVNIIGPFMLQFAANGQALAVQDWYETELYSKRMLTLWDVETGISLQEEVEQPGSDMFAPTEAVGGHGTLLAYSTEKGVRTKPLDSCTGKPTKITLSENDSTSAIGLDPLGRWIAIANGNEFSFQPLEEHTKSLAVANFGTLLALVASPDGRNLYALQANVTEPKDSSQKRWQAYEQSSYATLVRISVPQSLLNRSTLNGSAPQAYCGPTAESRRAHDFPLPAKPAAVQTLTTLAIKPDMRTPTVELPQAKRDAHYIWDISFDRDNHLRVLFQSPETDPANRKEHNGAAVWDLQTGHPTTMHFSPQAGGWAINLNGSWLDRTKHGLFNLLNMETQYSAINFIDPGIEAQIDGSTGEAFALRKGRIEHYGAAGQRLPDITVKGEIVSYSVAGGRIFILIKDGPSYLMQLVPRGNTQRIETAKGLYEGEEEIESMMLSKDGKLLFTSLSNTSGDYPAYEALFQLPQFVELKDAPLLKYASADRPAFIPIEDGRSFHMNVLDTRKGKILAYLPRQRTRLMNEAQAMTGTVTENGTLAAVASSDGLIRIWDLQAHQLLGEAHLRNIPSALAFSPDGKTLAVGKTNGEITLLAVPHGTQ